MEQNSFNQFLEKLVDELHKDALQLSKVSIQHRMYPDVDGVGPQMQFDIYNSNSMLDAMRKHEFVITNLTVDDARALRDVLDNFLTFANS